MTHRVMTTLRCAECSTLTIVDTADPDQGFDEAAHHLVTRHGYEWDAATEETAHQAGGRP